MDNNIFRENHWKAFIKLRNKYLDKLSLQRFINYVRYFNRSVKVYIYYRREDTSLKPRLKLKVRC